MYNDERKFGQYVGLPLWRYFKYFLATTVFSVFLVLIFCTFLPKSNKRMQNNFSVLMETQSPSHQKEELSNYNRFNTSGEFISLNQKRQNHSIEEIRLALNNGAYSRLTVLAPESLGSDISKETLILPEVKSLCLSRLKQIMTLNDWSSWKDALRGIDRNQSVARVFVDDIRSINFQLGRYVETAALLFSALYNNTANGRVFSAEETLYGLLQQSDQLFRSRTPTAISSRVYLDTLIIDDPSFQKSLEDLRSNFVSSYYRKEPTEIETHLILLSSIKSSNYSSDIIDMYVQLLERMSLNLSPRFREDLRVHYFSPDIANIISKNSEQIRQSIFNLYRVGISDFIKNDDISKAKANFLQLASIVEDKDKLNQIQTEIDDAAKKLEASIGTNSNIGNTNSTFASKSDDNTQKLFPTVKEVSPTDVAGSIEKYGAMLCILAMIFALIRRFRGHVGNAILSILKLFANKFYGLFKKNSNDNFIEELDASIKAGKTVPMKAAARGNIANKKAANS